MVVRDVRGPLVDVVGPDAVDQRAQDRVGLSQMLDGDVAIRGGTPGSASNLL